jgi:hypothetical protein
VTAGIVAVFQGQASLKCLEVGEPRFRLDTSAPFRRGRTAYHCVPGSEVGLDRKRDLRAPAEAWMESHAKAFEQRELSTIPYRIASRIRTDTKVEPHDGAPGSNVGDADAIQLAMFEAPQLAVGSPRCSGRIAQAQAGSNSGAAMLLAETPECIAGSPPTAIGWAFSRSHWAKGCADGLRWRFTAGPRFGTRNNGRTTGPIRAGHAVPTAICAGSRDNRRRRPLIRVATVAPVAPCYGRRNRGAR